MIPHIVPVKSGCWIWTRATNEKGYGYWNNRRAHRVVWETFNGPVASGMQLDHLCRVRCCVNPSHLEPVTCRENVLRGNGLAGQAARRTHCIHGHPFSGNNFRMERSRNGFQRTCRQCKRDSDRRRRSKP